MIPDNTYLVLYEIKYDYMFNSFSCFFSPKTQFWYSPTWTFSIMTWYWIWLYARNALTPCRLWNGTWTSTGRDAREGGIQKSSWTQSSVWVCVWNIYIYIYIYPTNLKHWWSETWSMGFTPSSSSVSSFRRAIWSASFAVIRRTWSL